MDQYLEIIKAKLSPQHDDRRLSHEAALELIEANYHRIAEAIVNTNSDRYEDYVASLRENVCENCSLGQTNDCDERNSKDCPLDRYYPMIVDAIEEIGIGEFRRSFSKT